MDPLHTNAQSWRDETLSITRLQWQRRSTTWSRVCPCCKKRMFCDRQTFSISAQIQFSSQFLPPLFLSLSQVKRCQRLGKRVSAHSTESDRKGSPSPPPPFSQLSFLRLRHAPGGILSARCQAFEGNLETWHGPALFLLFGQCGAERKGVKVGTPAWCGATH